MLRPQGDTAVPTSNSSADDALASAHDALARARERLLALQDDAGWWKGELQTNVTMDAEDLLLREFLGMRTAEETRRCAEWIRSQQQADGSWANFYGGPPELSTTVEAYTALRLAGDSPEAPHMRSAAEYVRGQGGIPATRVFTRMWLALFGLWSWDELPAVPAELILLPKWFPLNPYDFACWARQTIVAVSLVMAHRPRHELSFGLEELAPPAGASRRRPSRPRSVYTRWLIRLDRLLRVYQRHPLKLLRRLAVARAESWIVRRQESDGSWGGIQPPWVYSLIALHLGGYPLEHAVIRRGLEGLDSFMIDDGVRRLEACQSPVWDTALSVIALREAGVPADDPSLVRAADWLLDEQVLVDGDWSVHRPKLEPGGWAFEFANDIYPDVDDTTEVVLALLAVDHPDVARKQDAIERGIRWVEGMRSRDGGWGAFDVDNTRALVRDLPFCDFGEVIDPPSADVTAHALEMFARAGLATCPVAADGLRWLLDAQEENGSWFGRWGVNYIYGTAAALPALAAAGAGPEHPALRRAVRWLEAHQNHDGGWGEDPRSYEDPAWHGRGDSTPSQTAWALLALHAAGERSPALERGIRWLVDHQRPDGSWDEPQFTGTGFPGDFIINYHLYRLLFPVMALGRVLGAGGADGGSALIGDGASALAAGAAGPGFSVNGGAAVDGRVRLAPYPGGASG